MTSRKAPRSIRPRGPRAGQNSAGHSTGPIQVVRSVPRHIVTLVLVGLFAFATVFSAGRGYLYQRAQFNDAQQRLTEAQSTATALEQELAQWQDETYVRSQVRERLGYVTPGETTYIVVGAQEANGAGENAAGEQQNQKAPWYSSLQESARLAGGGEPTAPPTDPARRGWVPSTNPAVQPTTAQPTPQETP